MNWEGGGLEIASPDARSYLLLEPEEGCRLQALVVVGVPEGSWNSPKRRLRGQLRNSCWLRLPAVHVALPRIDQTSSGERGWTPVPAFTFCLPAVRDSLLWGTLSFL
jgi:hypothetical protein